MHDFGGDNYVLEAQPGKHWQYNGGLYKNFLMHEGHAVATIKNRHAINHRPSSTKNLLPLLT